MKHPEADYINAGYRYEKANHPDEAKKVAQSIKTMLADETEEDRNGWCYHLVQRGRQEARGVAA